MDIINVYGEQEKHLNQSHVSFNMQVECGIDKLISCKSLCADDILYELVIAELTQSQNKDVAQVYADLVRYP